MTWTILIIKKKDNGWFVNYIENKLLDQISKFNLQKFIEVLVFEPNQSFSSNYISVIDEPIEISDDFINVIYSTLKNSNKDCIGLTGLVYINNKSYKFNNISENKNEIFLPVTKLNPIKSSVIINNMKNIAYYLNSEELSDLVKTIDTIKIPAVFLERIVIKIPISILITAYKSQDYIEECLDSIERQTYFIDNDDFEVLVGVDNCKDTYNKLEEIKHKYRNLKIYMMAENKGTYITTNTLIELAKNEDCIRFDSDDIMTSNLVKEVVKDKKDSSIAMLGFINFSIDNDDIFKNIRKFEEKLSIAEGIIYFKRSVMINIAGGYMPWRCAADAELILRLVDKIKISKIEKALFHRRIHEQSLTVRKDTGYNSEIRLRYINQIKTRYTDADIKIERVTNSVLDEDEIFTDIVKYPISIIVTAYQTQDYIEECLDSIENQTYFIDNDDFEVLVGVDDCQDTLNKLQEISYKYRNLKIFMMNSNMGTYVTSNTLLDLIKYDNIIRFDSDDIMMPNMIKIIMNYFKNYDLIKFGYDIFSKDIKKPIISSFHFPHGVVLYKKIVFDLAGGYMPWKCAADTELLERIKNFIKIKEIYKKLFYRRQHENSLTRNTSTKYGSELRNFYRNLIGKHTILKINKVINEYKSY